MDKEEAKNIDNKLCKYLENSKDIEKFCIKNYKEIKEFELYHSGGGIWIFYILMDNKIYSISDEILDNNNSYCIIYSYKNGFNSIDDFFDFEEENYNKIYRTKYWDDFKKEFIKL
tara:strand:- start:2623 stop:2967 length:345 start_codon:yes stop_codon:yes gene_type:complete